MSDQSLALLLPVIVYWVYSLFFHWISLQEFSWFEKYRLHDKEEETRNKVSLPDVIKAVIVQQVLQVTPLTTKQTTKERTSSSFLSGTTNKAFFTSVPLTKSVFEERVRERERIETRPDKGPRGRVFFARFSHVCFCVLYCFRPRCCCHCPGEGVWKEEGKTGMACTENAVGERERVDKHHSWRRKGKSAGF